MWDPGPKLACGRPLASSSSRAERSGLLQRIATIVDSAPVAAQHEGPPEVRRQSVVERLAGQKREAAGPAAAEHPDLRLPQRRKLAHVLVPDVVVEALHEVTRGGIVDFPERCDNRPGPCRVKGPLQAKQPFAAGDLS